MLALLALSLKNVLLIASGVFCIGVYGVLSRQSVLVILMCIELMLNGANLALVAFGRALLRIPPPGAPAVDASHAVAMAGQSQAFVVMVLAVAAAEAAVGLAILLAVYRRWRTTNAGEIHLLSG